MCTRLNKRTNETQILHLVALKVISGKIIQTGSGSVQHRRTNSEGSNCIIGAVSLMSASIGDVVEESSANIEVNEIPRLLFGTHTHHQCTGSSGPPRSSVADAFEIWCVP